MRRDLKGDSSQLTPNLALVMRDGAQSARRALSRPFKADKYMNELMQKLVTDKHSITQRIERSDDFKLWFAEYVGTSRAKTFQVVRDCQEHALSQTSL